MKQCHGVIVHWGKRRNHWHNAGSHVECLLCFWSGGQASTDHRPHPMPRARQVARCQHGVTGGPRKGTSKPISIANIVTQVAATESMLTG